MKKKNIIFLILFLVYLGLVIWCCFGNFKSLPKVQREIFGFPTDKVVHFVMFLPFAILAYMSFDFLARKGWQTVLLLFGTVVAGLLMAVATEIGQSLTSYRSGDPMDFVADSTGIAVSTILTILTLLINKLFKKRQ